MACTVSVSPGTNRVRLPSSSSTFSVNSSTLSLTPPATSSAMIASTSAANTTSAADRCGERFYELVSRLERDDDETEMV